MTDLEISKALALAIGWEERHMWQFSPQEMALWHDYGWDAEWRNFDYRDWNVIGPIAERYGCFPFPDRRFKWIAGVGGHPKVYADTPQKAIAMAVIGAKK